MCPDMPESGFAEVKCIDFVLFAEGTKKLSGYDGVPYLPEFGFAGVDCIYPEQCPHLKPAR